MSQTQAKLLLHYILLPKTYVILANGMILRRPTADLNNCATNYTLILNRDKESKNSVENKRGRNSKMMMKSRKSSNLHTAIAWAPRVTIKRKPSARKKVKKSKVLQNQQPISLTGCFSLLTHRRRLILHWLGTSVRL
jgi:hypothetical protein